MKKRAARRTRNLEESRKEILMAAFPEVYRHGFQGVSVDEIVAKTSLTKGAFYHQFPTKLDLGYALVEEVITPMILDRWLTPLERFDDPIEGILAQLKKLIGEAPAASLKLGCPLNNLVQEMAPLDRGFQLRLQKALNLWIDGLDVHLQRAQTQGLLRSSVKTRDVAHFVVMAHEGFYGMLKGLNDPKAFTVLSQGLKNYFETLR